MLSSDPYIFSSSFERIQSRLFQISFLFHNWSFIYNIPIHIARLGQAPFRPIMV
jgi:hypothetical protein